MHAQAELGPVLAAYGFDGPARPITSGLINQTFAATRSSAPDTPVAVVQRLHPIFAAEVNLDLDAVSAHLAATGLKTPRLMRTQSGAQWVERQDGIWRALDYIEGLTLHRLNAPASAHASARAAGALVGRFHRAVDSLDYQYAFARAGVHDTDAHLARLAACAAGDSAADAPTDSAAEVIRTARELAADILRFAAGLPPLPALPQRHSHGDLKLSNILFAPGDPTQAQCLVDLDTLGRQNIAYELGDAMRSWCNPRGEDDPQVGIDSSIFRAAMDGYREGADGLLSPTERAAIVPGLETVCTELAARFCVDIFDDRYFGWDPRRYPSRRAHNLLRARGQLALARSVRACRDELASAT